MGCKSRKPGAQRLTMLFNMWAAAYIIPTFVCVAAGFSDPLVQLPYGTFMGKYSAAYNISYFRSIPFSAPPVGRNRFRAPQPVEHIAGVYDSDVPFPMCPQRTNNGSEDCLYLSLYSRPWAPSDALRPVMIFFYGAIRHPPVVRRQLLKT